MTTECFRLFYVFLKIGLLGFGGGYAMLSMIMTEARQFGITVAQLADLNALDLIVPGPIAINSATYVGYLAQGIWGAVAATIGVCIPSLVVVTAVMWLFDKHGENRFLNDFLTGVKPAAVGLIVAAAYTIASAVLLKNGANIGDFFHSPGQTVSVFALLVFGGTAVANIRFRVNPILLTLLAGVAGALLYFVS